MKKKQPCSYRCYYVCSSHKLTNCKTKYTVTELHDDKAKIEYNSKPHNHLPPTNPRLRKEVREHIKDMVCIGTSPAVIQKKFVNKAPLPLSSADVPTSKQVKNIKYSSNIRMKGLNKSHCRCYGFLTLFFAGDVLINIAKYTSFLCSTQLHPTISVVLASDFGLNVLTKSKYVVVDETFSTTECDLVLTTLFGFHKEVAIPCAYLLSSSKETKSYKAFYEVSYIVTSLAICVAIYSLFLFFQ
jgi:hypothetical protein